MLHNKTFPFSISSIKINNGVCYTVMEWYGTWLCYYSKYLLGTGWRTYEGALKSGD